jgi:hypothetical protein
MLAKDWNPAWIVEHRRASFLTDEMSQSEEFLRKRMDEFSSGVSLYGTISSSSAFQLIRRYRWGNMPAIDALNLPKNEKDPHSTTEFSLAFVGKDRIYLFPGQRQLTTSPGSLRRPSTCHPNC